MMIVRRRPPGTWLLQILEAPRAPTWIHTAMIYDASNWCHDHVGEILRIHEPSVTVNRSVDRILRKRYRRLHTLGAAFFEAVRDLKWEYALEMHGRIDRYLTSAKIQAIRDAVMEDTGRNPTRRLRHRWSGVPTYDMWPYKTKGMPPQ